jgi:hypothetical protein
MSVPIHTCSLSHISFRLGIEEYYLTIEHFCCPQSLVLTSGLEETYLANILGLNYVEISYEGSTKIMSGRYMSF